MCVSVLTDLDPIGAVTGHLSGGAFDSAVAFCVGGLRKGLLHLPGHVLLVSKADAIPDGRGANVARFARASRGEHDVMYIGIGALVVILVLLIIVFFARRV